MRKQQRIKTNETTMKFGKQKSSLKCPQCGADLSDSSPGTPCAACLLQLGMQTWNKQEGIGNPSMMPTMAAGASASGASEADAAGSDPQLASLAAIFPQLEIMHLVGQGGMGNVYCARQKSLNRLVALKVIRPESQAQQDFADRFVREARALAHLSHSNIVTVHDFGQTGDLYYFIMEYVDGINLRQMLQAGKLQPRQAMEIVPAICDALQYAHDNGVVHRDIKPDNILIDTDGKVKIADFGLAKLLDNKTVSPGLTQAHHVMGTMHYMAPEQFERPLDVDHRADIYSLGVVIYELLTGELPLGRFAPPSKKVSVDVRLDEIVLHTLEKEPELRYQRVSDVKSDMQSLNQVHAAMNQAGAAFHSNTPGHPNPGQPFQPGYPAPPVKSNGYQPPLAGPIPGGGFFGPLVRAQSYRNILYLLLSFPLGIIYFVVLVVGLSAGIGTLIVWVGALVLLGTFLVVRGFTGLERKLAQHLLRTAIPSRRPTFPTNQPVDQTVFEKAKNLVVNRETWAGVFYLLLKFPMGILSFVLTIVMLAASLSMMLAPITMFTPFQIEMEGRILDSPAEIIPLAIAGFVVFFLTLHAISGLAWLHSRWAQLCLKRLPTN